MKHMTAIGGDRIGAGGKVEIEKRNFERSNHNKSFIVRTTAAPGVVFPFLNEVLLPDDDSEINFNAEVLTLPTNGPLFGTFIFDIHVFEAPYRLYQADLHQNLLEIGNDMSLVKLPLMTVKAPRYTNADTFQIEPSTILAHLDFMGLGISTGGTGMLTRNINAMGILTYYDVIKCYYANKQEDNGYIIHTPVPTTNKTVTAVALQDEGGTSFTILQYPSTDSAPITNGGDTLVVAYTGAAPLATDIVLLLGTGEWVNAASMFNYNGTSGGGITYTSMRYPYWGNTIASWAYSVDINPVPQTPTLTPFLLKNIDTMRINILKAAGSGTPYTINDTFTLAPYTTILQSNTTDNRTSLQFPLEGLAVKTYQSDLFNNWVKTAWVNNVNTKSAINTSSGSFTMDTLNLAQKVYNHLNALAMAGGTYDDWIETAYSTTSPTSINNPIYHGGLRKEIAFQEVVSNSASNTNGINQPLGQLAGRGVMTRVHKGGTVRIKSREASTLLATFSITPRIDYSQGNSWINNLRTMDDLHKPIFDQIGFQDLITDQMAWFDSEIDASNNRTVKSAGKVPAWINYMTAVNKCRGNFAIPDNQMFMTLNRRYEFTASGAGRIKDLTTYIDPSKYNYIFAEADISAQNFWVHIGVDFKIRRKMSAKIMPNL